MSKKTEISEDRVKNKGGQGVVQKTEPYVVEVTIRGTDPILFHKYDIESVKEKGAAAKGSKSKKTDNLESYVYRNEKRDLVFPGINFKACLCEAARSKQDPRSPRKSLRDLLRAAIKVPGEASFGTKDWDFEDVRAVGIQRVKVTRTRPAMKAGWQLTFFVNVLLPEYVSEELLYDLVVDAGRLQGLGDFRPDFGCFQPINFERVLQAAE